MRTTARRSLREGSASLVVLVALLIGSLGLTGCGLGGPPPVSVPVDGAGALMDEVIEVLDARAESVRAGRLEDYIGGIDTTDAGFVVGLKQYYANLQHFPMGSFGYQVPVIGKAERTIRGCEDV